MSEAELPLLGGRVTVGVVRVGDTVRRPVTSDRGLIQALLLHLQSVGFTATPRFLGLDAHGRETLSFLPGTVPTDLGHYDDGTLAAAAALLRRFHDATIDFPPVRASGAEVMCHNDWGPPNAVFVDGLPAGLIDFDTLAPGLRLWDLGYSANAWLDIGSDDYTGDEQIRRLQLFAQAYGDTSATALAPFVLARQAALSAAGEAGGNTALAQWAAHCARWTVANLTEKLRPTRMMPSA